ncbi:MAG: alanine/ornithine racemase family PLP-dependent enzyme [Desulfopila sp.]|jgi:predicted amino acid racemase|nr:alanine/ornithine racemase family PLP-dependent enzyme [Desulfopila sp.]
MKKNPCLEINLEKLRQNATTIHKLCDAVGIEVVGITKGFTAIPEIAQIMIESGITALGDSRLENIQSLTAAGIEAEMILIRIPMLHEVDRVVRLACCSLNSEISVIKALSAAAEQQGRIHDIILMVDLGDLREGVLPEEVENTVLQVLPLQGIRLRGFGVNFNCLSGINPTQEKLLELVRLSEKIQKKTGITIETLSGGSTSSLKLVTKGTVPKGINQLRIGEGILLGHSDIFTDLENTFQDSFILSAEIIELKQKESTPKGIVGLDSFGQIPNHKVGGIRKRAILAIGKQDVYPDHISPEDDKIEILAASSDHLIVDVTDSAVEYQVGGEIRFKLSYPGILSTTTSKFVTIQFSMEIESWN